MEINMANPQSTLPNDEKKAQDSAYNPSEHAYREGISASHVDAGIDQAEAFANDPANHDPSKENPDSADAIRDAEDAGGNWKSEYGGNKTKAGRIVTPMNVRAILKKRGPLGLIAVLGLGGGLLGTALFSPGIILVHMKESLTDRFNTQLASMDSRKSIILNQKILGTTSGVCGVKISILCNYSTISEKQSALLKTAGIEVKGKSTIFGSGVKPSSYSFNGGEPMDAKTFAAKIKTDPALASAMKQAYNPKYAGFADKIWEGVASRLGINKRRALVDGNAEAKTKALDEEVKSGKKIDIANDGVTCKDNVCTDREGNDLSAAQKAARQAAIDASQEVVDGVAENTTKDVIAGVEDGATKGVTSIANFVKLTGYADTACQAYSSVRGLGYAAKTIRAIQLARYAMVFVNTADQIKGGTAKPEDVAYLGGILTNIAYDVKSGVKRKAAMDSAGMQYTLYGNSSGFKGKGSSYVSQFMAGGGLTGDLIAVTDYINSTLGPPNTAKTTCAVLSNGWVQAGSVIAGIGLMLVPGANVVLGISDIAKGAFGVAAGIAMAVLPDLLKAIVAGNVTKGLIGEDAGNAISSGFGVIASNTAQAGGNAPMSVNDAVAYTNLNDRVLASYTADEAKTLSPFDGSNKGTFVGSIVDKLLPFVSATGSIGNPLSALSSLTSSSLATILPSASAVTTEQERQALTSCNDPDYVILEVATDPFCNLVFGIPTQYLNRNPITVATSITGQYNPETGEPIAGSSYAGYVTDCINRLEPIGSTGSDPSGDDGSKCRINESNANYYLFYMDQRVNHGMNGYNSGGSAGQSVPAATADATIDQAHVLDDSTGVACAAGTTDAGITQGYHNGTEVNIRLCSIPGTADENHSNQLIRVNSRISGATLGITKALAASPANKGRTELKVSDSFRTMQEQQSAFLEYGFPQAAHPGFSNHQMGLAIDFQLGINKGAERPGDPVYDWLVANASTYGFNKIAKESWHWQAIGAN